MDVIPREYVICFDVLVLALAFGANAMAAGIIIVKTSLEKPENVLMLNLIVCNLICECLMGPQLLTSEPYDCIVVEFTVSFLTMSNAMSICLISFDQFIAIVYPLHSDLIMNLKRALYATILQWILSLAIGLLSTFTAVPAPGVLKICMFLDELSEDLDLDIYRHFFSVLFLSITVICLSATVIMRGRIMEITYRSYERNVLLQPFNSVNIDLSHTLRENSDVNNHFISAFRSCILMNDIIRKSQIYYKQTKALRITSIVILYCFISQFPLALMQLTSKMGVIPYRGLLLGSAVSPLLFVYQKREIVGELNILWKLLISYLPLRRVVKPADTSKLQNTQRFQFL